MNNFFKLMLKHWNRDPFQSRNVYFVYGLGGIIVYPAWASLFLTINNNFHDSVLERFLFAIPCIGLLLAPVLKNTPLNVFKYIFTIGSLIILGHHTHLVIKNAGSPFYIAGYILTLTAIFLITNTPIYYVLVSIFQFSSVYFISSVESLSHINFFIAAGLTTWMFGSITFFNRLKLTLSLLENKETIEKQFDALISTQEQLEEQRALAAQSSKMVALGEMASGIAHEINNPLTIIRGYSEYLEDLSESNSFSQEKVKDVVKKIQSTTDRIKKIVRGLMNFAHNTNNKDFEKIKLSTLVDSTLDFCRARFLNNLIELRIAKYDEDYIFEGNPVQLSQVLVNLLNNAFDAVYASNSPWVQLSLITRPDELEIQVTDSGKGISKDIANKIFQPFFTTKSVGQGTGLGLSISRGLIKSHKGDLYIDTTCPNTRFVVKIPRSQSVNSFEKAS